MSDRPPKRPSVAPLPSEPIVPAAKSGPQSMTLPQAMALAERQQAAGNLAQAESTLRQILQARPRQASALHLLGVVVHQQGKTELAIDLLTQAIEIEPRQAVYRANLGEMCRIVGRLDQAIESGEAALAIDPNAVGALSNLGIAHYDCGDFERAEHYQKRALAIDPRWLPALNNLGSIRRAQEDRDGAIDHYRQVLAIEPRYAEAGNNLGAVLTESERFADAVATLRETIRQKPNYADAFCNIGLAFCGLEQIDQAHAAFTQAIKLRPNYVEAHLGLARVLQEKNLLPEAEKAAKDAVAFAPDRADAHSTLGGVYADRGFPDLALASFEKALELKPDLVRGHLGLGALLMELGQLDRAEDHYQRALELDPDAIPARVSLAHVKKAKPGDDNVAALAKAAESIEDMPRQKAMALHFALGKSYDDVGEYDKAFAHFAAGCRIKRSTIDYDADAFDRLIDQLIAFFDAPTIARLRGRGEPSQLPVFVLGAARSGTTLTEQIIASHPLVHGAGELPDLLDLAHRLGGSTPTAEPFPNNMRGFTQSDLALLGARYVAGLRKRSTEATRITDKMPANFLCVGLIHLMLPNARVVHVRRNPVDTCLSGFSRLFSRGQPHSYDLVEIGRHYRGYARLMDHWRTVLPEGAMLEVQYEDLVADHEAQARRLIAFCGLEWSDACLDFFKNDRSIRTASVIQVRQPIYTTSLARWKRYEPHLGPLIETLGDLVEDQRVAT